MGVTEIETGYRYQTNVGNRNKTTGQNGFYEDFLAMTKAGMEDKENISTTDKRSVESLSREEMFAMISERMQEVYEKLKNNDTEVSFRIGSQSFTIKEWERLLEQFDTAEEEIREKMREEHAKRQEEHIKRQEQRDFSVADSLITESTTCTYPASGEEKRDKMYITWYTQEGIFCRQGGQTEGYFWNIFFDNTAQYDKVISFLGRIKADADYRFAANENFWHDYLKGEVDEDDFVNLLNDIE